MAVAYVPLTTKFDVHARNRKLLSRARLRSLLDGAPQVRLVLLSAPAGFGKTTLLTDWLADGQKRVAWISLDRADNDPARFLRYLREVSVAIPTSDGHDDVASRFAASPDRDIVLGDLLSAFEAQPEPALLVLDDYHVIEVPAIHAMVETLIERLPANARLVVATRADPPLPLARLRARGELLEIRADALRLTRDETGDFLQGPMELELAPDLVDILASRTEGWAAALQLAALSLRDRGDTDRVVRDFGAANRFLLDFVIEEVLANQSEEIEEFLLRTCVLDRLTGPLCDELTGRRDGAETLDLLERTNTLVFPLDQARCWYRYHQLFAELLQARLAMRDPQLHLDLHLRAASWFEAQGVIGDAIEHRLRGGDSGAVCRLVRQHWTAVMHGGELWTVQHWLDRLPDQIVRADPQLCATYAFGLVLRGETDGVVDRLDDARRALAAGAPVDPLDRLLVPPQLELIEAKLAELQGDPQAEIDHAHAAVALIPGGIGPAREALLRGDAMNLIGQAHLLAGDDDRAAAAFEQALPLLRRAGNAIAVAHGARDLVRIEIRRGDAARALDLCADLLPTNDAEPVAAAALHLARAEALLTLGDRDAARVSALRAANLSHESGDGSVLRDSCAILDLTTELEVGPECRHEALPHSGVPGRGLVEPLTPREIEVLQLVAAGHTNRQIAAELFVALGTAKAHVHSICGKLGATNRVGAIVRARDLGLLG